MRFYLASYPRSGNTFARYVLKQIFQIECLSAYANEPPVIKVLPKPQVWHGLHTWPDVYAVKTHHVEDADKEVPAIYIVRDGRDAIVSQAIYEQIVGPYRKIAALMESDEIQMHLTEGTWPYLGGGFWRWSEHVEKWCGRVTRTAVIRFEDLILSPVTVISDALQALDVPYEMDPTARLLTFSELQALDSRFFRKGNVGGYALEMPEWIQRRFVQLHGHMLERFEYQEIGK